MSDAAADTGALDRCGRCGVVREPSDLAWVHTPAAEPRWLCPACAREHVRDIEAKLSPEWWTPDVEKPGT